MTRTNKIGILLAAVAVVTGCNMQSDTEDATAPNTAAPMSLTTTEGVEVAYGNTVSGSVGMVVKEG